MILNDPFGALCRHTHIALAGSLAGVLRWPLGTLDGCRLGVSLIAPRAVRPRIAQLNPKLFWLSSRRGRRGVCIGRKQQP
jgi:hypothetical protein